MSRNRSKSGEAAAESAAERLARYRAVIEEMENSPEYQADVAMLDFACDLNRAMSGQGVSRAELARRLGTSPAYITKILRGDANLTLASMVKLAGAVGHSIRIRFDPAPTRAKHEINQAEGRRADNHASRPVPAGEAQR